METSKCGRCCIYSMLVITMLVSSLLFFVGCCYGRIVGDTSVGSRAIQGLIITVSLLSMFCVAALWIWMCKSRMDRKNIRKEQSELSDGAQPLPERPAQSMFRVRGYDGAVDGVGDGAGDMPEVPAWARGWSSDSSVRIWGGREGV